MSRAKAFYSWLKRHPVLLWAYTVIVTPLVFVGLPLFMLAFVLAKAAKGAWEYGQDEWSQKAPQLVGVMAATVHVIVFGRPIPDKSCGKNWRNWENS